MKDIIKKAKWENNHARVAVRELITVKLSHQKWAWLFKWRVTAVVGMSGYSSHSFINEDKANKYFEELIKKYNLKEAEIG